MPPMCPQPPETPSSPPVFPPSGQECWDIFCKVIDNLGDIGVCWRLARQLAQEQGCKVRLWVDQPQALAPLLPAYNAQQSIQVLDEVQIRHWDEACNPDGLKAADVVVEAFACDPPEAYLEAMTRRPRPPCWINLEYLSAEAWVSGVHGAASPHPRLPLVKFFFFPGFSTGTGGLLREKDLLDRRQQFLQQDSRSSFLARHGLSLDPDTLLVSLFCYDTAPIAPLLQAWQADGRPLLCLVPPGKPLAAVQKTLGGDGPWQLGQARLQPIPFLPQSKYDELLWSCDLNFVRGEDSFVRAQWAAKPFIWHIYPQEEDAHLEKLEAFLDLYTASLAEPATRALSHFWRFWNREADLAPEWSALRTQLPLLTRHSEAWCESLSKEDDLATALVKFCASRV